MLGKRSNRFLFKILWQNKFLLKKQLEGRKVREEKRTICLLNVYPKIRYLPKKEQCTEVRQIMDKSEHRTFIFDTVLHLWSRHNPVFRKQLLTPQ